MNVIIYSQFPLSVVIMLLAGSGMRLGWPASSTSHVTMSCLWSNPLIWKWRLSWQGYGYWISICCMSWLVYIHYVIRSNIIFYDSRMLEWIGFSISTLMNLYIQRELRSTLWDNCCLMFLEMLIWLSFQIMWVKKIYLNIEFYLI